MVNQQVKIKILLANIERLQARCNWYETGSTSLQYNSLYQQCKKQLHKETIILKETKEKYPEEFI